MSDDQQIRKAIADLADEIPTMKRVVDAVGGVSIDPGARATLQIGVVNAKSAIVIGQGLTGMVVHGARLAVWTKWLAIGTFLLAAATMGLVVAEIIGAHAR
jgi:hypothetical protein